MDYYPIAVKTKKRFALVVGGGNIAQRKIQVLLAAGIPVRLVSLDFVPGLQDLLKKRRIKFRRGCFRDDDLKGADLVIVATNDGKVNKLVSRLARKAGAWVNVVDQPRLSDFISPAVIRKQKAIIAVYTDGKDPVLSRDLKNFLNDKWNEFLSYRRRL